MKLFAAAILFQVCNGSVCYADDIPPAPPPTALSQQPSTTVTAIPPGDDEIVSLKKGQPAPFDGQLFENNTALRWGNYLEQYKMRLKIDVGLMKRIMEAEITYRDKVIDYERAKYNRVVPDLENKLAKVTFERDNPSWYKTTWFGVGLGVVGTCAVVGLTAWTFSSLK
jgi:hypothetical protein